ncbi:hypothetical protein GCM10020220_039270 [Nonomuraea rubra]
MARGCAASSTATPAPSTPAAACCTTAARSPTASPPPLPCSPGRWPAPLPSPPARPGAWPRVRQTGWAAPGSTLAGLHGYTSSSLSPAPQGTAFTGEARVPVLEGIAEDGWAISAAVLDERVPLPEAEAAGDLVRVAWPDGVRQAFTINGPR